jgi:ketosteroid isomerase-like protein
MMDQKKIDELVDKFLGGWNTQDVNSVLNVYTKDLKYKDPKTRGEIQGRESMRRYVTKLFKNWDMQWHLKEAFPGQNDGVVTALWRMTARRKNGTKVVEVDGMDLILFENDLAKRNEVYFDRMALLPLMGIPGAVLVRIGSLLSSLKKRTKK